MVTITSDNKHIKRAFEDLIKTLEGAGSGFHSQLCIDASQEGIRLSTKEPMDRRKEIIRIPRGALMPGDQYDIALVGDNFEVRYPPNTTLKDHQRTIINQMFEIYNLTNKVKEHKQLCFLLSLQEYPSLYEKMAAGREKNKRYDAWYEGLQNGMETEDYNQMIIQTFVQTRPLGYSDPVRQDSVSTIMPVIDFLNHHWEGANFAVVHGARRGDLTINAHQPFDDNTECFAFYGVLDACDSLFRYNFVDELAPLVRSIKTTLDLPDGRKMLIGNKGNEQKRKIKLPPKLKDLSLYAPEISFANEEGKGEQDQDLVVPHLIIPGKDTKAPKALRRVLAYAVNHMHETVGKLRNINLKTWIEEAEHKIVEDNVKHYQELKAHTEELIKEKGTSFGLERIKTMAEVQLEHLDAYAQFAQDNKIQG